MAFAAAADLHLTAIFFCEQSLFAPHVPQRNELFLLYCFFFLKMGTFQKKFIHLLYCNVELDFFNLANFALKHYALVAFIP